MDNDSDTVPDEVLTQKLERVVADAVSLQHDADHFAEGDWEQVLEAWQQLVEVKGGFGGLEESTVLTGEESDAVPDDFDGRVVEGQTQFGDTAYTLRLFCDAQGSTSGFRIVRTESAGVSGTIKDLGDVFGTKLSGLTGGEDVPEPIREEIDSIVAELDEYQFQSVYDRLTDTIKTQVRPPDIRNAWMQHAPDFVEIKDVQLQQGVINVTLRLEDGESTLLLRFTDEKEISTFRIK